MTKNENKLLEASYYEYLDNLQSGMPETSAQFILKQRVEALDTMIATRVYYERKYPKPWWKRMFDNVIRPA